MKRLREFLSNDTRYLHAASVVELSEYEDLHFMCSVESRQGCDDPRQNGTPRDFK